MDISVSRNNTKVATVRVPAPKPVAPKPSIPPRDFASAFHPLFLLSRALGLAPFTSPGFGKSRAGLGLSVAVGVVSLLGTASSLRFMGGFYLTNPTRNKWMLPRLLVFSLLFITAFCALVVAVRKSRRTFRKISDFLVDVDVTLFAADLDYTKVHRYVCGELFLALCVYALVLVVDGYLTFKNLSVVIQAVELAKNVMLFVGDCMTLQFISVVLFVKTRFQVVNAQLAATFLPPPVPVTFVRASTLPPTKCFTLRPAARLSSLRKAHIKLYDVTEELNAYFGLSLAIKATTNLVTIVSHVHSVLSRVKTLTGADSQQGQGHGSDMVYLVSSVLWVAYSAGSIVALAYCCHVTTEVAAETGVAVQECLLAGNLRDGDVERLNEFADQIARSPLRWSACGLFNLDLTLLLGIAATVTSYIIIMEQQ